MTRLLRPCAALTSLCLLTACATILHPERKGNRGGQLDTVPLVVDILLFIPGLIPGVIAIAVDFSTGAIYTGGGSADVPEVGRRGKIALRPRDLPDGSHIVLELVDDRGDVVDRDVWRATQARPHRLSVDLREVSRRHEGPGPVALALRLTVDDQAPAEIGMVMR